VRVFLALTAVWSIGVFTSRAFTAPTADEIIHKLIARSAAANDQKNAFAYQRVSRVDYLDDRGEVKKNAVRVYEVAPSHGKPHSRLVQINGRSATEKDEANRSAARETGDKSRSLELSEELLLRYRYTLRGEDTCAQRRVWVLDFTPKEDLQNDAFLDKLINAMHGTMWVDQEDYELARLDVHLGKRVSFFGGLAGAIDKLDLQIIQKRVHPSVWLSEALTLDFSGRKLFTPIRLKCFENCSGFRKVSDQQAKDDQPLSLKGLTGG